jgi:1,2-diacylglycerol-3-alpha-glucose alpha-1,2-glucosyltransferase
MKICVYLELKDYFEKNKIATGIYSSYCNQIAFLKYLNIPFVEEWDDSCDILQTNSPWPKSVYYMKRAKKQGKKVIIWAHTTVEDGMAVFRFMPLIAPVVKRYYTYVYGLADIVFCPSQYTKSLLLAYGLPEEKLMVQSNAVDAKKFFASPEKRMASRKKFGVNGLVVGTIGQVQPRKGTDTFLMLCEHFPQTQFLWAGGFLSKLVVKPLPEKLPANAKFTGFVDDVNEAFNSIDVFIFPSYEENQGMVILEAAAVGLPILVRDIPAYEGWLVHGENCLKAGNNEEFVVLLKQLLEDSALREKLSQAARVLGQKEDISVLGEKLTATYKHLVYNK